jgi:hypothetical protein
MPVAAAIAPEELTWNRSPEPTVNRASGEGSPTPTFPAELTTRAFDPTVRSDERRFVLEAVVAKKFVVVADVPVAVVKVKDWRVEEALATMFCAVRVPVRVCVPPLAVVKNRFVVEPVVAKKFVVVAFVPVALANRMFEKLRLEPVRFVAKKLVEVAEVVVPLTAVKF